MKKFFRAFVLIPLVASFLLFTSCSKDDNPNDPGTNPLVGTWVLTHVTGMFQGFLLTLPVSTVGVSATIITSANGDYTATWEMNGEVSVDNGQWYSEATTITMVTVIAGQQASTVWPFVLSEGNNKLVTTVDAEDIGADEMGLQGNYDLTFTRQ